MIETEWKQIGVELILFMRYRTMYVDIGSVEFKHENYDQAL